MHIKLVVNSFPTASETFLFNLVTALEKRGVSVTVCASSRSKDAGLYVDKIKEWSGNIQLAAFSPANVADLLRLFIMAVSSLAFFLKMVKVNGVKKGLRIFYNTRILLKGKPDIIHFSFSGLGITYLDSMPYLKQQRIKTVVSCRGTAEKVKPLLEPERGKKMQSLFSQVDLIHCVSKDMRDGLVSFGLIPAKTFINYPSIETGRFLKDKANSINTSGKFSIVTIGRLHFQKGYVYAFQAIKMLVEKNIPVIYNILGEGPDRPMLTYLVQEWGLKDHVVLHGKVNSEQVIKILNASNAFLLPSLYEGVSNAVLEAMAMELPVVSTHAGGMAEVIEHGVNGLLTDWRTPAHMANQLAWLFENPKEGNKMGKKARGIVNTLFSLDHQIDVFIEQYKNLLNISKN